MNGRTPTIEWQVCGTCNYDCSYCIQSKKYRTGFPSPSQVEGFLDFFRSLTERWEVKMTGGEPFAFRGFVERIIPGLLEETPHTISVLTNLSAPLPVLSRFSRLTRGRLGVISASLHLEFTPAAEFVSKAIAVRDWIGPEPALVVNAVLVPGRLEEVARAKETVERAGLKFFPQVMKWKGGIYPYSGPDLEALGRFLGPDNDPRRENRAPSYLGKTCWTGVDYLVLTQTGDAWSCRTAKRFSEGFLGNVLDGTFQRATLPKACPYTICPCTVPANRGMIEEIFEPVPSGGGE
ncbi:MAG: radical SAM protein [Thermoanaerobaculia bacterium]|nr:radical SAM protein [Thermoanaerobaculia bacterium]